MLTKKPILKTHHGLSFLGADKSVKNWQVIVEQYGYMDQLADDRGGAVPGQQINVGDNGAPSIRHYLHPGPSTGGPIQGDRTGLRV